MGIYGDDKMGEYAQSQSSVLLNAHCAGRVCIVIDSVYESDRESIHDWLSMSLFASFTSS